MLTNVVLFASLVEVPEDDAALLEALPLPEADVEAAAAKVEVTTEEVAATEAVAVPTST